MTELGTIASDGKTCNTHTKLARAEVKVKVKYFNQIKTYAEGEQGMDSTRLTGRFSMDKLAHSTEDGTVGK